MNYLFRVPSPASDSSHESNSRICNRPHRFSDQSHDGANEGNDSSDDIPREAVGTGDSSAMQLKFVTLDVFTSTPFKGNPLAIVTIPPGVALTQEQKQTVAREFNLSETVFVHDVVDAAASTERRIDIFTTTTELPFAGHPTIGSAVALEPQGVTTLITKAGPIAISSTAPGELRAVIPHNVRLHTRRFKDLKPLPTGLSANAELAAAELDAPVFSIVDGMTFALVELPSLELLAAVEPGTIDLHPAELLDEGWHGTYVGRYHYVRTGSSKGQDGITIHNIRARMAEHGVEDPATGSAACALSSYLGLREAEGASAPTTQRFFVTQGVEMGRESNISIEARFTAGEGVPPRLESLFLGGRATQVMRGTIRVEE